MTDYTKTPNGWDDLTARAQKHADKARRLARAAIILGCISVACALFSATIRILIAVGILQ